jgi:hypothetical protein
MREVQYQTITRKAHEEQKFLRFLKKQLKGFSQNTKNRDSSRDNIFYKKTLYFFGKNEVGFSYVGGTTSIAFPSAEAYEEGFTAIRNKNNLR